MTMSEMKRRSKDPDEPMWVIGCIEHNGAITGRAAASGGRVMHSKEESKGKRWRWNIWSQDFHATLKMCFDPGSQVLTPEEFSLVEDWLERRGYKGTED